MPVGTRFVICLGLVVMLAAAVLVWQINLQLRGTALEEARAKARLILDHNLAIHTYFTHQLKPAVTKAFSDSLPPGYFEAAWMSSTYAVRGIDHYFKKLAGAGYYYKECAINARDPRNEADAYEKAFLQALNRDPKLMEKKGVRELDGQDFYQVLRRGESMEATCLRCHSQPERAPQGLVEAYGAERSFHRSQGEVVSAISIRIPLEAAYAQNQRVIVVLSSLILAVLLVVGWVMFYLNRRFFSAPLQRLRGQVSALSREGVHLGAQMPLDLPGEWNQLAGDFNTMSASLGESYDTLEQRVRQRTAELEEALAQVRQLSGLLPICASCKRIRDDQGYWQQLEVYLRTHSEVEFSHSICPACQKVLYPDLQDDE